MEGVVPQKGPAGGRQGQGHTPFEVTLEKWRSSYERDHAEHLSKLGDIMRRDMEDRLSSYQLQLEEEENAEKGKAKEAKDKRLSNHRLQLEEEENVEKRKAKEAKDNRLSKLKEEEDVEMRKVKEAINARIDAFRKEEEAKAEEKTREMRQKIQDFETSFVAARSSFSLLEQTAKSFHVSLFQDTPEGMTSPSVDGSSGHNPPPQSPPTKERTGMLPKKKKSPPEDPASTSGSSLKRLRMRKDSISKRSMSISQETPEGTTSPNFDGDGSSGQNPSPQSPERTRMPPKKKIPPAFIEDPASTLIVTIPLKRLRKDFMGETKSATTGDGDQATTSALDSSTSVEDDETLESQEDGTVQTSTTDTLKKRRKKYTPTIYETSKSRRIVESLSLHLPTLSPCKDGDKEAEKFFKDLKNQLNSPLSYLKISGTFSSERDVLLLDKIFQMVSPTLQHLVLEVTTLQRLNLPFDTDWTFGHNLKILEMSIYGDFYGGFHQFTNDIFVKIGPTSLESFIGRGDYGVGPDILGELIAMNDSTLTEISLDGSRYDELCSLSGMSTVVPLQKLTLYVSDHPGTVHSILDGFSKSLVSLNLKCFTKLCIPRLEKLEVFSLEYNEDTFTWPDDWFSKKFPALKTLTLDSSKGPGRALSDYTKAEAVIQWIGVIDNFIPSGNEGGQDCLSRTLVELNIPHCPPWSKEKNREYDRRVKVLRQLFPNVNETWIP